jgi:hypothetical protein
MPGLSALTTTLLNMSHSQNSIFISSADNLIGVWMVREIMRLKTSSGEGSDIKHVYAGVYSTRSPRAHELFTLGATVIEINPQNKSEVEKIAKSAKGVVVIPPLESRPNWYEEMEECLDCLKRASPQVAVMLSSAGVSAGETGGLATGRYSEIFKKLGHVEEKFKQAGESKKWAIVRNVPPQEFMLHYSRLIQETGTLMLPTGSGKCAFVSLHDVTRGVVNLIMNPKGFHTYTFTGPEALDGKQLVDHLNRNIEAQVSYENVEPQFTERYLRTEFPDNSIAIVHLYLGLFELIKSNKLSHTTDDMKKISNKEPRKVDELFKDFAQLFRP